ncbi:MAG: dihydroorotase [Chlamydiae bacterium]|nr:dihydroorotase [Chlamydiota bacterium]MBI3277857.1 dihydroorotase [Chlamydiota bacterium]
MSTSLLIQKGRIVDPSQNIDEVLDLLIENGKIQKIAKNISAGEVEIFDARGKIVAPGFIDLHVHFREPGFEHKETILTGMRSAAMGGFTAVCCMPNTEPAMDEPGTVGFVLLKAKEGNLIRVYPIGAATRGREGKVMTEIGHLKKAGVIAISDDGEPIYDAYMMRRVMEYAHMFGLKVIDHCEDKNLSQQGVMNEGYMSTLLGLTGIPSVAEEVMVMRDILMSQYTQIPVHLAHLSTRGSVDLVRWAKAKGLPVTAETAPHYFSLSDEEMTSYRTEFKMNPPLRTREDVKAIQEGLKDGTLDAIATDHAPHQEVEKEVEFDMAPFGIIGLETSVGLGLNHLVHPGILTLSKWIDKMSCRPAQILNLPGGNLRVGENGDVTILDLGKEWSVGEIPFESKSKNSPFREIKLKGKAVGTIVGGRVVMRDGEVISKIKDQKSK